MKICAAHWQQLRDALDARGLTHLISKDGEALTEIVMDELNGVPKQERGYDPLYDANMMIWSRALQMGGLYLMTQKADGSEYCPLCEVEVHLGEGMATEWINGCTEAIRKHCQEQGLVPPTQ